MKVKLFLGWFVVLFSNFYFPQSVTVKYKNELDEIKSTLHKNPNDYLKLIKAFEGKTKSLDNDTLKAINLQQWGNYNMLMQNIDQALLFYRNSEKIYSHLKLYRSVGMVQRNMALGEQNRNNIDAAIAYMQKSIENLNKENEVLEAQISTISLSKLLKIKGNYNEANQLLLSLIPKIKDAETLSNAHAKLAENFDELGNSRLAEDHYRKGIYYTKKSGNKEFLWRYYANFSDFLNTNKNFSESLKYSDSILQISKSDEAMGFYHLNQSNSYKNLKRFDEALFHIDKSLEIDQKQEDQFAYDTDLLSKAQIFLEMNDYKKALELFTEVKKLFKKDEVEDAAAEKQLHRDYLYAKLKLNDNDAFESFEKYNLLNDSLNSQNLNKNMAELDTKYKTTEKESQIKSQQLQLEKEKSHRNLAFGGVGILGLLSLGGFLYFTNRHQKRELENKNTLLSLQQNLNEMELQNLNKQLDPHEIKNFLATISPEIQVNAPEAYKKMIKLLNLTKASLNSGSITENILVQIAQIEDYLSLERQILNIPLEYQIINEAAQKNIQIPRLLLKNLVENSIKHGIKNRKEAGKIVVNISENAGMYEIVVDDNGSGRKEKVSQDSGIGISTYQKLFKTLNEKNAQKASFNIHDKEQGTKVEVKIPKNYNYF